MTHIYQIPTNINEAGFYGNKTAFYGVSTPETEPWYCGKPLLTAYTRVYLPFCNENQSNSEWASRIIGNRGENLIYITETNNIHYIWYNNDGYFELWGDERYLPDACTHLIQSFYC
jgi:hypothetical protein